MRTNKFYIIVILSLIGCKKNDVNAIKATTEKTFPHQRIDSVAIDHFNNDTQVVDTSFVISCGSGCAMTYIAKSIVRNASSVKVEFEVEMYVDERLSDTYNETYVFYYNNSHEIIKIQKQGENENIMENSLPAARDAFIKFGAGLNRKNDDTNTLSNESDLNLPFNRRTDPKSVRYTLLSTDSIQGIQKFKCDSEELRYVPLPKKGNITVILVPQDCGDFEYRYYLLTLKNNVVMDNLYVEGEWYEPDAENDKETTMFSIDKNYNILVKTSNIQNSTSANYIISETGKIVKK